MNSVSPSPGLPGRPRERLLWERGPGLVSLLFLHLGRLGAHSPSGCVCLIWQWDVGRGWEALKIFGTASELVIGL